MMINNSVIMLCIMINLQFQKKGKMENEHEENGNTKY